jgi:nicotinate-nucleotide adenylyltransferase
MLHKRIPGHIERVGLFGGTFDPIHLGHLILAEAAMEELDLDRIIFIPAGLSPFKTERPPMASNNDRLFMLKSAIANESRFSIDERELSRTGPSYTVETVREMLDDHPGVRFIYLIGADNLKDLQKWHQIDELRNLVDFAVLGRGTFPEESACDFPVVCRRIDLSSTEIRKRLAAGLSIRFMVPGAVYDFLMHHNPYRNSPDGDL